MNRLRALPIAVLVVLAWHAVGAAQESPNKRGSAFPEPVLSPTPRTSRLPLPISLNSLPAPTREAVNKVMQAPTVTAVSPADQFTCASDTYLWLLDHPDRVCLAWKRLNVAAINIKNVADSKFCWKDEHGSEVTWQSVAQNGEGRIWYAEGKVRPGALLPTVPVKAVAVLRHGVTKDDDGEEQIRHQIEVFLQTDSKTAAVVMRMLGPAAPRMAEDGAEQMLLFFSGIARYVDRHPSKSKALLAEK